MDALLLITDDIQRGQRLARDLGARGVCRVHDLYEGKLPPPQFDLIISDVEALTSDAIIRLRRALAQVRTEGLPYLFLVHGNAARAEVQARILGASATADRRQMSTALDQLEGSPIPHSARVTAAEARQFFQAALFSGGTITPAMADAGTDLVVRAVRDCGVYNWVQAVRQFDDATHQHCLIVAALSAAFSGALGMRTTDRHRLTRAALLHDVGKIHVPIEILNKPGQLSHSETVVMRTHAAHGHAMLNGVFDDELLAAVRSHHEMLDGSGYPDGLKGLEIPDFVRLVTVCDVYGALIERRSYRAPISGGEAYGILQGMVGRVDGDLTSAFRPIAAAFDPSV